jgi:hypothetical protein
MIIDNFKLQFGQIFLFLLNLSASHGTATAPPRTLAPTTTHQQCAQ